MDPFATLYVATAHMPDPVGDKPDAIVAIDFGMTATKASISLITPAQATPVRIPVAFLPDTLWTPTAVSYRVDQHGQHDGILKTGHEALQSMMTKGVNVYKGVYGTSGFQVYWHPYRFVDIR